MHWGIRRFQDKNGRRTAAGKKRYQEESGKSEQTTSDKKARAKKYAKIGAGVAVAALGAYIGYKAYQKYGSRIRDDVDATLTMRKMKKNLGKDNLEWIKENLVINSSDNGVRNDYLVKGVDFKKATKAGFKQLEKAPTLKEVAMSVNPTNAHNNCSGCVGAAIAQLSGSRLNVKAKANINNGEGMKFSELCKMFGQSFDPDTNSNAFTVLPGRNLDAVSRTISRKVRNGTFKVGDIGVVGVTMDAQRGGNGHVFYWVVSEGGKVIFSDGQSKQENCESRYMKIIDMSKEIAACKLGNRNEELPESVIDNLRRIVE